MEPLLGYHPCSIGFLTSRRDPAVGQCQTGSLTGAVASERVSEAPKGCLLYTSSTKYVEMDGNILRYSPDGVSLVSDKMSTLWSETYQMQNPVADVNGTRAVIADKDGTTLELSLIHIYPQADSETHYGVCQNQKK